MWFMHEIEFIIPELETMKKYPDRLYGKGDLALLKRLKVSIIGSRRPGQYAQQMTYRIASGLAKNGVCVVSGAAMGVDAAAHTGAGAANTIAVLPSGIEVRYPALNAKLIASIEEKGLTLSQFDPGFKATPWSFVVRNETVVALGDVLIVTQADPDSGSMRSVEFALAMGKKVYVLPHRIGESEGTNTLLAEGRAEAIWDIEAFISRYGKVRVAGDDPFLRYCLSNPSYDVALANYGERLYEAELEGLIAVENGRIKVL
jgi:DNA processing protein